jgi:hypothetical protein
MQMSSFDPTTAVSFDLDRGQVSLFDGAGALVLGVDALAQVCRSLDAGSLRGFGEVLGKQAGKRVRGRLGAATLPTLEDMVDQLGGELALAGLGRLSMERWGQALVVRVEGCPLGAAGPALTGGYVAAAIAAATGRTASAEPLEGGSESFRLLLCSQAAAARVRGWLATGRSWGDALAALHGNDVEGAR